jgi:polysaccharide deacetylase 2 family uncharacterized protein YibQ
MALAVLAAGSGLGFIAGHWGAGQGPAPVPPAKMRAEADPRPAAQEPRAQAPERRARSVLPPAPEERRAPTLEPLEEAASQAAPTPPPDGPREPAPPAWLRYAATAPEARGRPMIAVVIDDLGFDAARTARAVALKGPLTLSFLPHGAGLGAQTEAVRAAGHELLVHVPMEPESAEADPGPNALIAGLGRDEVLRRLRWALGRFDGYVGINNHMGSLFTRDGRAMAWVLEEVKARGLLFLDSRTTAATTGARVAAELGVPHAQRKVFLDTYRGAASVRERLAEVERAAREQGTAIALGHPHDATLEALAEWLPTLEARGFVQVPVSAIVRRLVRQEGGRIAARPETAG